MKKLFILISFLSLSACYQQMNNDEVIREHNKCEKAGMQTHVIQNGFTHEIINIICKPREGK